MDYQELYNTIESKLKDIKRNEEIKLELAVNIYLVILGLRTSYFNGVPIPISVTDLEFVEYIKVPNNFNGNFFYFIVNKDFYKSNINLFERLGESENKDEMDTLIGKIIGYPCAGKLDDIVSEKHINIRYITKKDSIETEIFVYKCPYDVKEKSIKEAKDYLKNIKKVLKFININVSLEVSEQEENKAIIKTNKKEHIKEAQKRIHKISNDEEKILFLYDLEDLSEKDVKIPKGVYKLLWLQNNNFSKLEVVGNNKGELKLMNNKIKNIQDLKISGFSSIQLSNNPILKNYLSYRKLDKTHITSHKKYKTINIKKGTVLFRSMGTKDDIKSMFIGYQDVKNKDDNFYLNPDHHTFFHTSPMNMVSKNFGNIRTMFILNNDIELILGLEPSKLVKEDIINEKSGYDFYSNDNCKDNDIRKQHLIYYYTYSCLKDKYKDLNIMGWFSDDLNLVLNSLEDLEKLYYIVNYKTKDGYYLSEISMYPRTERFKDTITTKIEDFDEDYMKNHLEEFNYKPFMIFDETVSNETYKEIFDKLLSVDGFTNEDGTFHITVNKIDGTYVLAEEANKDTLKDCVPIREDRVAYLKDYIRTQK
jgi:hypothetical protein